MTSAAGDTSDNAQSNKQEDNETETKNESQEKSVQAVASEISHPSIFDLEAEDKKRNVWRRGYLFTVTAGAAALWLKIIFRLPQLLLKRSGGAFIIAFVCTVLFLCVPLACLETLTGQYGGKPFLMVMGEIMPVTRGVGFAIIADHFLEVILYGVNLSQLFVYCFLALKSPVPWEKCDAQFNTQLCATDHLEEKCIKDKAKSGYLRHTCVPGEQVCQALKMKAKNESHCVFSGNVSIYLPLLDRPTAQEEYYEGEIRNSGREMVHDLNGLGRPNIRIALASGVVWLVVTLGAFGRLTPQPYIAIISVMLPLLGYMIFVFYVFALEGSGHGISQLLQVDVKDLTQGRCWTDAAALAFACMNVGYGTYPTLASKNRPGRRSYFDVLAVGVFIIVVVFVTTISFYGLVGSQAKSNALNIDAQLKHNNDMIRVLFPTALGRLSLARIWTLVFFLTMAVFGIGSMTVHMACVISDLSTTCSFKYRTAVLCVAVMLSAIGVSLFFSLAGTVFILDTIEDSILGSKKVLLSLLFLLVVIFIYGPRNLIHHVRKRLRVRLLPAPFFWQLSWYIICPLGLIGLLALAALGRGGTFFRDDVPLWIKLMAVAYEFYYWVIILFFLVQTAVAWKHPTRPRGVWRLEARPDDAPPLCDGSHCGTVSDESLAMTTEPVADLESVPASAADVVESSPPQLGGGEGVPEVPKASEAPPEAAEGGETATEPEEDLTLPGERRRAAAAEGAVGRIRGLERQPGPDEEELFVRLHSWSRGSPKPPTPPPTPPSPEPEPPPSASASPSPPPPRLPSLDSIQTEYTNFLGRQSPELRARGLPVPAQQRIEREGASRLPWRDEQLRSQFGANLLDRMSPFTRHGLFGRGRVTPEFPARRSPEWTEPRRAASVAATVPEESQPPPRDTSEDTPSLMDMLRNMKS